MILSIATHTGRECLRRPLPYVIAATVVMLSAASRLVGLLAFGAGVAEAINMAVSAVLLAGLATAAFVGTALVRSDLERGTLALLLSQPVGPAAYVVGRFLGLGVAVLVACALAAAGIATALLVASAPEGVFTAPLFLGWIRAALAILVLAAAALAVSAFASRILAPLLLLAVFLAGDIAPTATVSRLLPSFGIFGLDAGTAPPLAWLSLYAIFYCIVFLVSTYLQIALRPPKRTES